MSDTVQIPESIVDVNGNILVSDFNTQKGLEWILLLLRYRWWPNIYIDEAKVIESVIGYAILYQQQLEEKDKEIERLKGLLKHAITGYTQNEAHIEKIWQQFKKENNL